MLAVARAVAADDGDAFWLSRAADDGSPLAAPVRVDAAALAALESDAAPRWIFDVTASGYAPLLRAGVRVRHSHDVFLTERILLARFGQFGQPCRAAAVLARSRGATGTDVPADPDPAPGGGVGDENGPDAAPTLFGAADLGPAGGDGTGADGRGDAAEGAGATAAAGTAALVAAYLDQRSRIAAAAGEPPADGGAADTGPGPSGRTAPPVPVGALRLLIAAESGSALVAAEMTARGLPWDAAVHEQILLDTLGPEPAADARPARMARLAAAIEDAFGFAVNPDSAVAVRDALSRVGLPVESTRAYVLARVDHPAAPLLIAYKELARLYSANGWHWLRQWVRGGRLASEYLPGAVVSGRWATRGGGGLQIPKAVRAAARAHDGHRLVVADAAQLEPRVLAARSGDAALLALAAGTDLYEALAADGFGGDRRHAKLAMLGAMYGQTSGEAARLMVTLRERYPAAIAFVERAAELGQTGGVVSSVLGRPCPPPSTAWRALIGSPDPAAGRAARRAAGDRGRFTRNFVIQASAADWAAAWMTSLRLALMGEVPAAEIVFFQHDELVMHVPTGLAERVAELTVAAAERATELVFPGSGMHIPVRPRIVTSYADTD